MSSNICPLSQVVMMLRMNYLHGEKASIPNVLSFDKRSKSYFCVFGAKCGRSHLLMYRELPKYRTL